MPELDELLPALRTMHDRIRDAVVEASERQHVESLAAVAHDEAGDTIYAIDKVSEALLIEHLERVASADAPLILIAEGVEDGAVVLPRGSDPEKASWRIIVDPIDGTRGIMYQKRAAWILTGVAPNRGAGTRLEDIELAVQTEIPVIKQHLCDQLWARRGDGRISAERLNRLTGEREALHLRASAADTILHGYAMISRFFPGTRDVLAAIDEEIVRGAIGAPPAGKAPCFEDQYASTGGQLYELMAGHDRFNADLRPLMNHYLQARGLPMGLCCHPYDLAAHRIAAEAGVILTDPNGQTLDAPLDLDADVAWVGYANEAIRQQVEPELHAALKSRGLLQQEP